LAGYPVRWIMNAEDFKERTKRFALRIIQFVESMRGVRSWRCSLWELLRAGTSVGANYDRRAGQDRAQNSRWESWKRNPANQSIGWNCSLTPGCVKEGVIAELFKESEISSLWLSLIKDGPIAEMS
jgi:hypothetical protein